MAGWRIYPACPEYIEGPVFFTRLYFLPAGSVAGFKRCPPMPFEEFFLKKSTAPGRHPVRRSRLVTDERAKVEALSDGGYCLNTYCGRPAFY